MTLIARNTPCFADDDDGHDLPELMGVATRRMEPRFIEPAEADAAPIIGLHRGHDGFVTFHKRDARGQFCNLFSVKAEDLEGTLWPDLVQPHLDTDAYFSVNGYFRDGHKRSEHEPRLRTPVRNQQSLRWLTACYVDLDCYKLGITVGQCIGAIIDMQDSGIIPPASMLTRSGQGVWAFWMLRDRLGGGGPQRASSAAVLTYRRLQAKLGQLTVQLGHDAQARDLARITRVPGTLHGTTGAKVAYWFQADRNGEPFTYELLELCGHLNVAPGELDPTIKKIIDPDASERARRAWCAMHAKRLDQLVALLQLRQGFRHGHRARGLWLYAGTLRKCGIEGDDLASRVRALGRRCRTADGSAIDPLPDDEIDTAIREAGKLRRVANQTIADWLDITPEESLELNGIPCAQRFRTEPLEIPAPQTRAEKRAVRRAMLESILRNCGGELPTLEVFQLKLAEHGMEAAPATISGDLVALGVRNPRAKRSKRREPATPLLIDASGDAGGTPRSVTSP